MPANPVFSEVWNNGRTVLTEIESKQFLSESGIPVVSTKLAKTRNDVKTFGNEIGFPSVMKIISPDIIHKSDIGGVRLNLKNGTEALQAYDEIMQKIKERNPGALIHGVSVQKMAAPGLEIIIGMFKDAQFGPMLMFGLGGIMVEALKDVSFRIIPVTADDTREMIREIKGYSLLTGFRGSEAIDIPYIEQLLLNVSNMIENHPEIKELDLNPVIAYKNGAIIVDSRIILEEKNYSV